MSRDLLTPRELGEPTSQSGRQITKNYIFPGSQPFLDQLNDLLTKKCPNQEKLCQKNFVHKLSQTRTTTNHLCICTKHPYKLSNTQKNLIFYDSDFLSRKIHVFKQCDISFPSRFEGRSLKMIGKYLKFGEHLEQKSGFCWEKKDHHKILIFFGCWKVYQECTNPI